MSRDVFTACPNGDPGDAWAHDFNGYAPNATDANPDPVPLIFCARCGETRELVVRHEAGQSALSASLQGTETR